MRSVGGGRPVDSPKSQFLEARTNEVGKRDGIAVSSMLAARSRPGPCSWFVAVATLIEASIFWQPLLPIWYEASNRVLVFCGHL